MKILGYIEGSVCAVDNLLYLEKERQETDSNRVLTHHPYRRGCEVPEMRGPKRVGRRSAKGLWKLLESVCRVKL